MTRDHRTLIPDDWEAEVFEKIRKQHKPILPTSGDRKARRSARETSASRKIKKVISNLGGMHRRRRRKIY